MSNWFNLVFGVPSPTPTQETVPTIGRRLDMPTGDRRDVGANIEEILAASTFDLVNEYRRSIGLHPVVRNAQIDRLCKQHCLYMYTSRDISHAGFQTIRGPAVREMGFTNSLPTENIAGGECESWRYSQNQASYVANQCLEGWLNSTAGHAENIRTRSHVVSGIGCVVRPTTDDLLECFVVQIFGS